MLEAKGLEAGAREEARWDGRDFDALGSADRSRYLGRFADGVTAYLEAVGGEPVQAPAVRVKGLADKLKLAEYVMTKDSFCEAERLEEGLSVVRRIRSALVATPPAAMTCDEQFALATKLAGDLGYDLVPEPPHPDTPVDNFSGQTIPPAERVVEALREEYLNASKDAMELAGKLNAAEADKARLSEARRLVDGIDEERRGALDLCVERNKEIARLSAKLAEARAANERDRTEVCMAVNSLSDAFARRDWLMRDGRGSYEWDDDRFRDEFRDAMAEFEPHIDRLRKIGADRTNCPETQAEVRIARAALSGSGSGWPVPDGWKLVPVEPTWQMQIAGRDAVVHEMGMVEVAVAYRAMIAASPAAPQQGGE